MESAREWWIDWLGVDVQRDVPRHSGPVRPADVPLDRRWTEQEIVLGPEGDNLTHVIVRPADGDGDAGTGTGTTRRPAVVVPFYDVPSVLGRPSTRPTAAPGRHAFAAPLVAAGFVVMVVPWWFEAVTGGGAPTDLDGRYGPPAARHAAARADTPLGRSLSDVMAAVDHLRTLADVDPDRIGVLGHSLGGKLAVFAAALDRRIVAGVAHEPGLGLEHSNWSAPWYLGGRVPDARDLDEVLGLVAPRPFLLAGGGASDGAHNRDLVDRAAARWGQGGGLDVLLHNGGHPVPPHVLGACVAWLTSRLAAPGCGTRSEQLDQPHVPPLPGAESGTTGGPRWQG